MKIAQSKIEDLKLAGRVQKTMLRVQNDINNLKTSIVYHPHDEVSGDIYDIATFHENHLRIFLGDATGHGISAAFMTMMVQVGLDQSRLFSSIIEVMTHLNSVMSHRDSERYMTGILVDIDHQGHLTMVNSGHPPMIFIPAGKDKIQNWNNQGSVLGILPEVQFAFKEIQYQLQPGDKILLYTDGIYEWENPHSQQFGRGKLSRVLEKYRKLPIDTLVNHLVEDVKNFTKGTPAEDDITILGFEYTG